VNHLVIIPVLLPLVIGSLLLLVGRSRLPLQRRINAAACLLLLFSAAALVSLSGTGVHLLYALGNWPAPHGIILVVDRLSGLMLLLTSLVALASLARAVDRRIDEQGPYFHALFQFQLMGLNGAFLTGDLFNLFVFFEVLLIASYGLLLHGGGPARHRAGLHYVVLNVAGSALFLIAIGILYGLTGTLNMAELAARVAAAGPQDAGLLRAGALLLLVVFGLKAALLPLYMWLPEAYRRTSAAVAALFAIMTKVGAYAIVRMFTLVFPPQAGDMAGPAHAWLLPLALATLAVGALGVLASRDLRRLLAYFVVVSVGTLLTAVGLFSSAGLSAALVYLIHSTLITAAFFLVADMVDEQRGSLNMREAMPVAQPLLLGTLFFAAAVALAGLPPLSGFLGKFMILQAAGDSVATVWVWAIVLATSLLGIVALGRAGSALLWKTGSGQPAGPATGVVSSLPALLLLACGALVVVFAGPVTEYTEAAARQLMDPDRYVESVLMGPGRGPGGGA
jgi:multicomponent K+:H+ antiporter subunit D